MRLWDLATREEIATLEGHTDQVSPYLVPTAVTTEAMDAAAQGVPATSGLEPNAPNPFDASTRIP